MNTKQQAAYQRWQIGAYTSADIALLLNTGVCYEFTDDCPTDYTALAERRAHNKRAPILANFRGKSKKHSVT